MSYNTLRVVVKDPWEKVGQYEFKELINSRKDRYQAIINTKGCFTKY